MGILPKDARGCLFYQQFRARGLIGPLAGAAGELGLDTHGAADGLVARLAPHKNTCILLLLHLALNFLLYLSLNFILSIGRKVHELDNQKGGNENCASYLAVEDEADPRVYYYVAVLDLNFGGLLH